VAKPSLPLRFRQSHPSSEEGIERYPIEVRGADKKPGPMGKGLCGKDFFVLIFCYFFIKEKVIGRCGYEQTNVH
jgi:hypothetical protein